MSLILNIDTSTENGSISLAANDQSLCLLTNSIQKDHSSWLHVAIQEAFRTTGRQIKELQAVGLTAGPGSYTGLRIGMAAAKGLCFSLDIPIIAVSTLEAMASVGAEEDTDYLCPMIDARRMEVYTALYTRKLDIILPPSALILNKDSFSGHLKDKKVLFFGNGANKFMAINIFSNAIFKDLNFNARDLVPVTYGKFARKEFSPLAYLEPAYLKEYSGITVY